MDLVFFVQLVNIYIYYNNLGGKQTNTDPKRIPQRKEKYNRRNKQKAAEPKKASQKEKKRKKEKKRRTKDKKSNLFIGEAA